jgi:hypothetical protein
VSRLVRRLGDRNKPNAPRGPIFILLLAITGASVGAAWIRNERLRAISSWTSRLPLQIESTEGLLWPTRLNKLELDASPNFSVSVDHVELGFYPWQRTNRAHGVVIRGHAPLDMFWEKARHLALTADLEVLDARIEYTEISRGKIFADNVSFKRGAHRDYLHVQSLHAFGTTFRDLHLWAGRPRAALEIRFAREAEDTKAPTLNVTRSPGEGVEWALDIPSQPLSEWADRIGLRIDQTWAEAVFVGIGSVIVPDSPALSARGVYRFTVDNWHLPSWPEARLLTGRSGAVALRISPGPGATHAISRVEITAGLFSLVGDGQLSFGEPNRLTFRAQGELSCALLLAHLPASNYREHIQAYLRENRENSAQESSIRLELSVQAEAPHGPPLKFRWRLHAGCGLSEMSED